MERQVKFTKNALKDLKYWKKIKNEAVLKRIRELIESIKETPYTGIGNPEPLKHELTGSYSRRINREHRLVYRVYDNFIEVSSLRFHYNK